MVRAVVCSTTDTIGCPRPERRYAEPCVTGPLTKVSSLHQSHGSAVVAYLPRVIRTRPR